MYQYNNTPILLLQILFLDECLKEVEDLIRRLYNHYHSKCWISEIIKMTLNKEDDLSMVIHGFLGIKKQQNNVAVFYAQVK